MIQYINIENFQSHKNSTLELSTGVNVILGTSDSGKSAIIRALRWLVWNRPLGKAFCRIGTNQTSVQIMIDDVVIERNKTRSEEAYLLDSLEFKAFGTEVPQEISEALNINEINLQQQLDRPFLLDSSPGEVASHFNRVAYLEQIDVGLKNIQSWIRAIEGDVSNEKKNIEQFQVTLKRYENLDKREIDVEVLEEQESRRSQMRGSLDELNKVVSKISFVQTKIEPKIKLVALKKGVNDILYLFSKIKAVQAEKSLLLAIITSLDNIAKKEIRLKQTSELKTEVDAVLKNKKELAEKEDNLKIISGLVIKLENITKKFNNKTQELVVMKTRFKKEFPNTCPLCGTKIEKDTNETE